MYPKIDLFRYYEKHHFPEDYSKRLPDITGRYTLNVLNKAINCSEAWNNFLDIGAGSGNYSEPLLHKFKKGVAVEPSPSNELKKLGECYRNLNIKYGYIQDLSFSETFDFVMMADVFEHIPTQDIDGVVGAISNLQKIGGVVYLLTPNPIFCGPAEKSDLYYTKQKDGHYKHYTKNEIVNILKKKNYELIFYSYEERPLRQKVKWLFYGISRKVKFLEKNRVLNFFSQLLVWFLRPIFSLLGCLVLGNETKNSDNPDVAISIALVFKKTM